MPRSNDVMAAFRILLKGIDAEVASLNEEGATTFRSGDYDTTQEIAERARWVSAFRKRAEEVQREWDEWCRKKMSTIPRQKSRSAAIAGSVPGERLHSDRSTPAGDFRRVIFEALVERAGRAPCGEVLRQVYEKMKDRLSAYDLQPIPSDPDGPRWRRNAHWCRLRPVHEGLLAQDSPRGIWQITALGREALARLSQRDDEARSS